MRWTEYGEYPTRPLFDLGILGYLNHGGSEGLFLRVPAIGPEEPMAPLCVVMRAQFDRMADVP